MREERVLGGAMLTTDCQRDGSALTSLKGEWESLVKRVSNGSIFQTWQWQNEWWKAFGGPYDLRLLAHRTDDRELIGITPLYLQTHPNGLRILRLLGGVDLSDYLDFIHSGEREEELFGAIIRYLTDSEDEWDLLDLHSIPGGSTTLGPFLDECSEAGYRTGVAEEAVCPVLDLPSSWEDYLSSLGGKERHETRRKLRRLQKEGDSLYRISHEPEGLRAEMKHFLHLHRKSRGEKERFLTPSVEGFFISMADALSREGWLKLHSLEVDGMRIASILCFEYGGEVMVYNSGYDPEHSRLSAGIALFCYMIKEAIERGIKGVDFLRGDERYKYRLGARRERAVYRAVVHKPHIEPDL